MLNAVKTSKRQENQSWAYWKAHLAQLAHLRLLDLHPHHIEDMYMKASLASENYSEWQGGLYPITRFGIISAVWAFQYLVIKVSEWVAPYLWLWLHIPINSTQIGDALIVDFMYCNWALCIAHISHYRHYRRWCTFFKPAYFFPQKIQKGLLLAKFIQRI